MEFSKNPIIFVLLTLKNKPIMTRTEILKAIENLAPSQGYYGQLYNFLTNGSEQSEEALYILENQNFKDIVDMIMFLEN